MNRQFDADALMALVPLIYRSRDAELVERGMKGPLQSLIELLAEQIAVLEDGFVQAYDDLFIETCAPWVVPYIGALIGYVPLPGAASLSERAQVAHSIASGRRKGTPAMLHRAVADTTGWGAHVVQYAARVAATQAVDRSVGTPAIVNVRGTLGTSVSDAVFETTRKTVDVRRIAAGRGTIGLANVGVHLWRLQSYFLRDAAAARATGHDGRAYRLHPLGVDTQLFTRVRAESPFTGIGAAAGLALPLSRERLTRELHALYGRDGSLFVVADGRVIPPDEIVVRSLAGKTPGAWASAPADRFSIDPELGRLIVPHRKRPLESIRVSFCYGFGAAIGGGPYERSATFSLMGTGAKRLVSTNDELQSALDRVTDEAVIEIVSSDRFEGPLAIELGAGMHLTLRAADGVWPTFPADTPIRVSGERGSRLTLSGLAIGGAGLAIEGELDQVRLFDCTLAPPGARHDRTAVTLGPGVRLAIFERCISGPIAAHPDTEVEFEGSIIDGGSHERAAIAGTAGNAGPLSISDSTVRGRIETVLLAKASNALMRGPVRSERFQGGCVRYSYVAPGSSVPQRYMCVPHDERDRALVEFTSSVYGTPGYAQLAAQTAHSVRHGADDGQEIGAFHAVSTAGREAALHAVLDDALPLGMHVGIRYMT